MINKKFWKSWSHYVGINQGIPGQTAFRPISILNDELKTHVRSIRLKSKLTYLKDYVLIPKRVWIAFVAWYGRSSEIERPIIKY